MAYLATVVQRIKEFDERVSPGKLHSDLLREAEQNKKTQAGKKN
jgi:hypothetical protein